MATLSELQTRLEALDKSIHNGVLTAEVDGERVTYRSMDEMMTARSNLVGQISAAEPTPAKQTRQIRTYATKAV